MSVNMEHIHLDRAGAGVDAERPIFYLRPNVGLENQQLNYFGRHASRPAYVELLAQPAYETLPGRYQDSPMQSPSPVYSPGLQQTQMIRYPQMLEMISLQGNQLAQQRAMQPYADRRGPYEMNNSEFFSNVEQRNPVHVSCPGRRPDSRRVVGQLNGKREVDILLPERHDDAECHFAPVQKPFDSGIRVRNFSEKMDIPLPERHVDACRHFVPVQKPFDSGIRVRNFAERMDIPLPERHDDADRHFFPMQRPFYLGRRIQNGSEKMDMPLPEKHVDANRHSFPMQKPFDSGLRIQNGSEKMDMPLPEKHGGADRHSFPMEKPFDSGLRLQNRSVKMDKPLPEKHGDADRHSFPMEKPYDSGLRIQNGQDVDTDLQLSDAIDLIINPRQVPTSPQKKGNGDIAKVSATRGKTVPPGGANRQQVPRRNAPASATPKNGICNSPTPSNQGRRNMETSDDMIEEGVRQRTPLVEDPPGCQLVDLTGDDDPRGSPTLRRERSPVVINKRMCYVCDKAFFTADSLAIHMVTHKIPKNNYKCNICNTQCLTDLALAEHKEMCHKEQGGSEMVLPVVDLNQPGATKNLVSLGIRHVVPLSQLQNHADDAFGIPIIPIDNARNPAVCNLGAVGASSVLSLGPIKAIGTN